MNYKLVLYAVFLFLGIFIFSGVNIEKFMKRNKVIEANLLVISLACALSYLLTNFVLGILNIN